MFKRGLFFIFFCFAAGEASGQSRLNQVIHFPHEAHPVIHYINIIKEKYPLAYSSSQLDLGRLIIPNRTQTTLGDMLKDILREQPVKIIETKDRIFITGIKGAYKKIKEPKGNSTVYLVCSDLQNPDCYKINNARVQEAIRLINPLTAKNSD